MISTWRAFARLALVAARTGDLARAYDAVAPRYEEVFGDLQRRRADHLMRVYLDMKGRRSIYLAVDLGCGTGVLTRRLGSISDNVIGLDRSEGMLLEARKRTVDPRISFRQVDMLSADEFQRAADLVACLGVVSHVKPEHYGKFAEALTRRVAPGGVGMIGITAGPWRSLLPEAMWSDTMDRWTAAAYNGLLDRLGIAEHRAPDVVRSLRDVFSAMGYATTHHATEDGLIAMLVEKRRPR